MYDFCSFHIAGPFASSDKNANQSFTSCAMRLLNWRVHSKTFSQMLVFLMKKLRSRLFGPIPLMCGNLQHKKECVRIKSSSHSKGHRAGRQCGVRKGAISTERAYAHLRLTHSLSLLSTYLLDYSLRPQLVRKHTNTEARNSLTHTQRTAKPWFVCECARRRRVLANLLRAKLVQIMKVRLLTSTVEAGCVPRREQDDKEKCACDY